MPTTNKLDPILNSLTHNEVEILIRKYLRRMQKQLKSGTPIQFQIRETSYDKRDSRGYWTVGYAYSDDKVVTTGEVLNDVVQEHNRRSGFKSTLLLLENDVEPLIIDGEAC